MFKESHIKIAEDQSNASSLEFVSHLGSGERISDDEFDSALELFISVHPHRARTLRKEDYILMVQANKEKVRKAKSVLRRYCEQSNPQNQQDVQDLMEKVMSNKKNSSTKPSLARYCINEAWAGICEQGHQ